MEKIRIKYLTDEGLTYLKTSFDANLEYYKNNDHSAILKELEDNHYLNASAYEVEDFTDKLVYDDTDEADYKNIKVVYEAMRSIPDYIMMDDRFWAGITHTFMWDYIMCRREKEAFSEGVRNQREAIYNSFFTHTKHGKKRGTYVNCVSRLWWTGRLTYDENEEDHFILTEELCKKGFPSTIVPFSSSNVMSRKENRFALLTVIKELREKKYDVKRDDIFNGIKYLNLFAGITVIDLISYEELYKMIWDFYNKYYNIYEVQSEH